MGTVTAPDLALERAAARDSRGIVVCAKTGDVRGSDEMVHPCTDSTLTPYNCAIPVLSKHISSTAHSSSAGHLSH